MRLLGEIYNDLKSQFQGFDNPKMEARWLIEAVTGLSASDFMTRPDYELSEEQVDLIQEYAARRLKGGPLSKILGVKEFWGLEFDVNEHVLDPRPDTETLIEVILKWVGERKNEALTILDLGTGTGCITIALLSELPNASAVAVDISDDALKMAAQNAEKHKMSNRIEFIQSDWFEGVGDDNFDVIVSNPPYIPESDIDNLSPEVKNHDPILALSGGDSGLECYKKIIFFLKDKLNGKNRAFLEIGIGQLESLSRLVDDSNLLLCDSVADLGGIPRVVEISCGDK